jgi:hypothetical protein
MFAGMRGAGQSMFGSMASPDVGPSPEEMNAERQRVLFKKHVQLKAHHVRVFDMHDPADVKAYEKQMKILIAGVQAKSHVIWDNDRQLVTRKGEQGWQRYMEWSEFVLNEEATAPVGVAIEGK